MSTAAQVLAIAIAVMLVAVFVMESFLWKHPRLYPLFLTAPEHFEGVRLWTINLGFYNLTTAVALVVGVAMAEPALVVFTAAQHTFLAVVLVFSERRLWFNALLEGIPALALLILAIR